VLDVAIISPALARSVELLAARAQTLQMRDAADYLPRP